MGRESRRQIVEEEEEDGSLRKGTNRVLTFDDI